MPSAQGTPSAVTSTAVSITPDSTAVDTRVITADSTKRKGTIHFANFLGITFVRIILKEYYESQQILVNVSAEMSFYTNSKEKCPARDG